MTSSMTTDQDKNQEGSRLLVDFATLRQSPIFAGVNHDVVKLLAYLSTRRSFQPGDYLIQRGKKANHAFIIISGTVEITIHHKAREMVIQKLGENSVFGELALLAQFEWFFNARAASPVEVIMIDQTTFKKVIEKFPEQKDRLTERVIQNRIYRMETQTTFLLDQLLSEGSQPIEIIQ